MDQKDDGLINAADMNFDFEDYFDRFIKKEVSSQEENEFTMRVMGMFCREVWRVDGGTAQIPFWVANYVAEAFYKVLGGEEWHSALPLPWTPQPQNDLLTRRGRRGLEIYALVENEKKEYPGETMESLLRDAAERYSLAYETVRDDFYEVKAYCEKRKPAPAWFMKKSSET